MQKQSEAQRDSIPRPRMASEALQMLKDGKEIEMESKYCFAFMRLMEAMAGSLTLTFSINKYNEGWAAIVRK